MNCGYVSIIGRPNVGKSTLLNRFLGQKLSITSRKPQTTRHQFLGIKTIDNYQMLFVDTPGIHSTISNAMNRYMNQAAKSSITGVDVILLVIHALKFTVEDEKILKLLENLSTPVILVINKVDRVENKELLLAFIKECCDKIKFAEVCNISALKGTGVNELEITLRQFIPQGLHLYPEDDITNRSLKFIAAERIREKLMRRLGEELPYSITVSIDAFEQEAKISKIYATIWVNKARQKGVVIGKNGAMLKSIGTDARRELEPIVGSKIFLKLWVKVRSGWADDIKALQSLGYSDI